MHCSAKSTAAAKAAKSINKALKVNALQNRVSPATEDVFNDKFWGSLNLVVNALDNVNARLYVDSRCVYFGKPLLESGTLGPKCNTQVVMPNMTENYGGLQHASCKAVFSCMLKSCSSCMQSSQHEKHPAHSLRICMRYACLPCFKHSSLLPASQ